jgi:acyl-CoA thioester hydrolase
VSEVEVWKGGVAMWECDQMGHLNVGFYVAKSMEALVGLAAELGMPHAFAAHADSTLLVREQHIRFIREARPGAPLTITAGVLEMSEDEARLLLLMRHRSGEIAAVFQTIVAHVTAGEGRPFPWPDRIRARAAELAVDVPLEAAPKSVGLAPVKTIASLDLANHLGLTRTALGAIGAEDCDAFGRMRTERFIARISDGIPHFMGARPGTPASGGRVGGAALEYRLVHFDWPRAGDRVELRSGSPGADARFRRLVHWLLDPATGRPWASAEAVVVSFDLETRKIISLDEAQLAAVNADAKPELAL